MTLPHYFSHYFFPLLSYILNVNWCYVCTWNVPSVQNKWWLIYTTLILIVLFYFWWDATLHCAYWKMSLCRTVRVYVCVCVVDHDSWTQWLIAALSWHSVDIKRPMTLRCCIIMFISHCSTPVRNDITTATPCFRACAIQWSYCEYRQMR